MLDGILGWMDVVRRRKEIKGRVTALMCLLC